MKTAATIIALLGTAAAPAGTTNQASFEQTVITPAEEMSDWNVRVALYGWAQALEGDITVRGTTVPLDLSFGDILEDLDMAFMGLVAVEYGRWGFMLDMNYSEIGTTVPTPLGIVAPFIDFTQEQWLVNSVISYGVVRSESTTFDLFAGARLNSIQVDLGINALTLSGDQSWLDPIVGLRFQQMLSRSFFFRAVGDIGGFGVSSDSTWQAMAAFGWRFSDSGNALIGYRAIDTDYEQGNFAYDINAHGPVLGLEFTF